MESLMKFLKWLLIVALSLGALLVIAVLNADSLGRAYDRWTFEHENPIPDVYIGMPKEDILFKYGEPFKEHSTADRLVYSGRDYGVEAIAFYPEENALLEWASVDPDGKNKGPKNTETLLKVAGMPYIESHNSAERTRWYTYLTDRQTGITYYYDTNKLVTVIYGKVTWRTTTLTSFYSVKGTQVCPGEMCPWTRENDEDVLKEQWKDKTVWDLIDEYDL